MKQAVLDTDILSYLIDRRFSEVEAAGLQYIRVFRYFTVSVITVAEVVKGFESNSSVEQLGQFMDRLDGFELLTVGPNEAVLAGRILGMLARTGEPIGLLDPFIAASAIEIGRPLVTNNIRHYQRIIDLGFPLELENWKSP